MNAMKAAKVIKKVTGYGSGRYEFIDLQTCFYFAYKKHYIKLNKYNSAKILDSLICEMYYTLAE